MRHKIIAYQDFNMTKPWLGEYEVEFKGNKARVHGSFFIVGQVSRFNKVHCYGKASEYFYGLTVNGNKCFFKSEYNING